MTNSRSDWRSGGLPGNRTPRFVIFSILNGFKHQTIIRKLKPDDPPHQRLILYISLIKTARGLTHIAVRCVTDLPFPP